MQRNVRRFLPIATAVPVTKHICVLFAASAVGHQGQRRGSPPHQLQRVSPSFGCVTVRIAETIMHVMHLRCGCRDCSSKDQTGSKVLTCTQQNHGRGLCSVWSSKSCFCCWSNQLSCFQSSRLLANLYNGHLYIWNTNDQSLVKSFEVTELPGATWLRDCITYSRLA